MIFSYLIFGLIGVLVLGGVVLLIYDLLPREWKDRRKE